MRHLLLRVGIGEGFGGLGAGDGEGGGPLRLVAQAIGGVDVLADDGLELFLGGLLGVAGSELPRILGGLFGQLDDAFADFWRWGVGEHDGAEHDVFRSSLASDSTIITASSVPATTRSRSPSATCVLFGLRIKSPST